MNRSGIAFADQPSSDVQLVNCIIRNSSCRIIELLLHQRSGTKRYHRPRAAIHVVVEFLRYRSNRRQLLVGRLAPFNTGYVANHLMNAHGMHDAQLAGLHQVRSVLDIIRGPVLHTRLHDTFVFPRRLDHLPAFPDVVGDGLLHIHVLARLAGPYGPQAVPVVRRGVDDNIHLGVVQHLAEIGDPLRRFPGGPANRLRGSTKSPLVGVRHVFHRDVGPIGKSADQICSPAAASHQAHDHLIAGRRSFAGCSHCHSRRQTSRHSGAGGVLHETSSVHRIHGHSFLWVCIAFSTWRAYPVTRAMAGRSRLPSGTSCCRPSHSSRSRSASGTYRCEAAPLTIVLFLTERSSFDFVHGHISL